MRLVLAIFILVSSCESKKVVSSTTISHNSNELKLIHSPPVKYPSVDYDKVVFFSVNAKHYRDEALVPLNSEQKVEKTIGFAILDSLGNPAYQSIENTALLPAEINKLQSIFHLPENKGEITKMECVAFYRDAFVFYRDEKQVAQVQIRFDCKHIFFLRDTTYLSERFSTDGDWLQLKDFISKVKVRSSNAISSLLQ